MKKEFSIIGDNIVECLRFLTLLQKSIKESIKEIHVSQKSFVRVFFVELDGISYYFSLYPGHNRWGVDAQDIFAKSGVLLRESPDVLVLQREGGCDKAILSVEFCSALSAGNQAWQRHGRALSLGLIGIPYIFITHIGGNELNEDRQNKSLRLPNACVPLSFYFFSQRNKNFLSAYLQAPDYFYNEPIFKDYKITNEDSLSQLAWSYINLKPDLGLLESLAQKNLSLCELILKKQNRIDGTRYLKFLQSNSASRVNCFELKTKNNWAKKISIPVKPGIEKVRGFLSRHAFGIISNNLPFCVLMRESITEFLTLISQSYGYSLPITLAKEEFIVITFIAGFKPRGDDSRPDRGLLPFVRMLMGLDCKVISFIYGPIKQEIYKGLLLDSKAQDKINGLWQSVNSFSDYVVLDPSSMENGYHIWANTLPTAHPKLSKDLLFYTLDNVPKKLSEHDIDSFVNQIFTRAKFFEGLCNPPGGDWAGVSIPSPDFSKELRWTSLPRVTRYSKRPDHIYVESTKSGVDIYVIESKEKSSAVEEMIGDRLKQYLLELFKYAPNAERCFGSEKWNYTSEHLSPDQYNLYSGFCAFDDRSDKDDYSRFLDNGLDFVILFPRDIASKASLKCINKACLSLQSIF